MKRFQAELTPVREPGGIGRMHVRLTLFGADARAGDELARIRRRTVGVPGAEPLGTAVSDELGALPFVLKEWEEYPVCYLGVYAGRAARGPVVIEYDVAAGSRPDHGRHGPYFEWAAESGGVSGPGFAFLMAPAGFSGALSLVWHRERLEEGDRCVCTWGEGDLALEGPAELLTDCYYMLGPVRSVTEGEFGLYWLTEPEFDAQSLAAFTRDLFARMQAFFLDDRQVYRVFMREDHTETSGGTALRRSYMFGWNRRRQVSQVKRQILLAHEMVHNWPHLNDEPYGVTTWYSEGTAEYYSLVLPLRAGLISREQALRELQERTDAYYTNPTRHLSNMEAARAAWEDRRAQRLSYGRGLFYLAGADRRIRRASGGRVSLDDVVRALILKDRQGVTLGNQVYLDTVRGLCGLDETEALHAMCEGKDFAPDADSLDALFTVTPYDTAEQDTGKPAVSYRWGLRREG